jgi:predicted acetyltransferase
VITIGPPRHERDWAEYAVLVGQAFADTAENAVAWVNRARPVGIVRMAFDEDRVVAGAIVLRVAQLFGGREVRAGAVAGVCVALDRRGAGTARALMADVVATMRADGCLVSPLWPSTVRLYRRCGWEVAGGEWRFRVPTHQIVGLRGDGHAVANPGLAVRALQRTRAAAFDGPLVRPDWWWKWRFASPPPDHTFRYAWVEGDSVTGLLDFRQEEVFEPVPAVGIEVMSLWTSTADAQRGLLGLLGSHSSMSPEIRFHHAALPSSPHLQYLTDLDGLSGDQYGPWMLRLVDAAAALEARGWPGDVAVGVALEVDDPFVDAPQRFVLEVEGGQATTRAGGDGDVRIGVGALSAWYSGRLRMTEAARLGLASGEVRFLTALDRLTGDRDVWLPDHF